MPFFKLDVANDIYLDMYFDMCFGFFLDFDSVYFGSLFIFVIIFYFGNSPGKKKNWPTDLNCYDLPHYSKRKTENMKRNKNQRRTRGVLSF